MEIGYTCETKLVYPWFKLGKLTRAAESDKQKKVCERENGVKTIATCSSNKKVV
jgi:hypothetical protein